MLLTAEIASFVPVLLGALLAIVVGVRGSPASAALPPLTLMELWDCSNHKENNAFWEATLLDGDNNDDNLFFILDVLETNNSSM
jgi:hypothetical protein